MKHQRLQDRRSSSTEPRLAAARHEVEVRDHFITAAAHELRNPLSPIYMHLEHLKECVRESPGDIPRDWLSGQLAAMTSRLDHFLETLDRLLDASRIGEGHLVLEPQECDLVEVMRAALATHDRELRKAGCTVELDAPSDLVGWWDRCRLEQLICHLLSNATRYGAGRPITIRMSADDEVARLEVQDRGIGIAAEDLSRIFHRFERARNVGANPGFGIGLWIVAELCRAMGGRVEVASELGKGATFTVNLPRRT